MTPALIQLQKELVRWGRQSLIPSKSCKTTGGKWQFAFTLLLPHQVFIQWIRMHSNLQTHCHGDCKEKMAHILQNCKSEVEGGLVFWCSLNCIKAPVQTHIHISLCPMWINSSHFFSAGCPEERWKDSCCSQLIYTESQLMAARSLLPPCPSCPFWILSHLLSKPCCHTCRQWTLTWILEPGNHKVVIQGPCLWLQQH